jgi:hypothetical protein
MECVAVWIVAYYQATRYHPKKSQYKPLASDGIHIAVVFNLGYAYPRGYVK